MGLRIESLVQKDLFRKAQVFTGALPRPIFRAAAGLAPAVAAELTKMTVRTGMLFAASRQISAWLINLLQAGNGNETRFIFGLLGFH